MAVVLQTDRIVPAAIHRDVLYEHVLAATRVQPIGEAVEDVHAGHRDVSAAPEGDRPSGRVDDFDPLDAKVPAVLEYQRKRTPMPAVQGQVAVDRAAAQDMDVTGTDRVDEREPRAGVMHVAVRRGVNEVPHNAAGYQEGTGFQVQRDAASEHQAAGQVRSGRYSHLTIAAARGVDRRLDRRGVQCLPVPDGTEVAYVADGHEWKPNLPVNRSVMLR